MCVNTSIYISYTNNDTTVASADAFNIVVDVPIIDSIVVVVILVSAIWIVHCAGGGDPLFTMDPIPNHNVKDKLHIKPLPAP